MGPREDFDWANACLEMEQLITCWASQAGLVARQVQEDESGRLPEEQQQRAEQDGQAAAEGPEDGGEGVEEGVGVAGQEVAFGANEVMEVALEGVDGDMQLNVGGGPLMGFREEVEERLEEAAAAMMEERDQRAVLDAAQGREVDGADHQEDLADREHLGDGGQVEVGRSQPPRTPSPPPALECISLASGHIAQVNSVLLVGDEGKVCATGSRDWNVKLWDLQEGSSGALLHTLGGQGQFSTHRGWVWCLASRGPLLASGGFDSTVRLWDLEAGGAERGLIRARAAVLCLSCQTDVLLAGTFDKRVSMYDIRGEGLLMPLFLTCPFPFKECIMC